MKSKSYSMGGERTIRIFGFELSSSSSREITKSLVGIYAATSDKN